MTSEPELEDSDPLLDISESPRFTADDPDMLRYLQENGYVVVRDVASGADLERARLLLWEFLGVSAGWSQRRPSTWTDDSFQKIGNMYRGIVNGRGAGQSDLSWYIRTLPCVRQCFEKIWSTSELITSFDGLNVFRPWNHGFLKTVGGWYHVDQGRTKLGLHSVQGLVSLYNQGPHTGGLVVVPGSHLRHAELVAQAQDDVDFIAVPQDSQLLAELPRRLVSCQAGDLVLWDSRCVHCNTPAVRMPTCRRDELLRACVYVCMTPKAWATEGTLEDRRKGYEIRMTSSHYPHTQVMGFGWVKGVGRLDLKDASAERRALIG